MLLNLLFDLLLKLLIHYVFVIMEHLINPLDCFISSFDNQLRGALVFKSLHFCAQSFGFLFLRGIFRVVQKPPFKVNLLIIEVLFSRYFLLVEFKEGTFFELIEKTYCFEGSQHTNDLRLEYGKGENLLVVTEIDDAVFCTDDHKRLNLRAINCSWHRGVSNILV